MINGIAHDVEILDTGCLETNEDLLPGWTQSCCGLILVYDTSSSSTASISKALETVSAILEIPIALVGTKTDKMRKALERDYRELARVHGAGYFETSARYDEGIDKPFLYLLKKSPAIRDSSPSVSEEKATTHQPPRGITSPSPFWRSLQPRVSSRHGGSRESEKGFETRETSKFDHREPWNYWLFGWLCGTGME